jgi:hypothetical protein
MLSTRVPEVFLVALPDGPSPRKVGHENPSAERSDRFPIQGSGKDRCATCLTSEVSFF